MTDATTQFFEKLGGRGHEPMLEHASGTIRFDIANGKRTDHWLLSIDKGDVSVAHRGGEADTALGGSRAVFEALASGKTSPVAAVLRGTLTVEGDWRRLFLVRRILSDPPATERPTAAPTGRSRR